VPPKILVISAVCAALALAASQGAAAKELSAVKVCGAGGCETVRSPALLRGLIRSVEAQGSPVSTATPLPSPYYRLEFWVRGDESNGPSFVQYYAPSRARVALSSDPGSWAWVGARALRPLLDRVSAGVRPFPTPRISQVTIGGRPVQDPASYARLFRLQGEAQDLPAEPDWRPIAIRMDDPGPWSTNAATLEYSPSTNVLWRSIEFVPVPTELASRLEARRSLAGRSNHSFPWAYLFGGLGGAAVILPTTLLARNRRRR
jgi:hypothetical protein